MSYSGNDDHDEAEARLRAVVMNELSEIMQRTGLPPMSVLRLAVRSVGTIYREMANAHSGPDACTCGWRPHPASDGDLLVLALLTACERSRPNDLRRMQVAGTA